VSDSARRSRADLTFAVVALAMHLAPLAVVASLMAGEAQDLRTQAASILPLAAALATAQVALAVAARRAELVGLTQALRGGWTLTLPVWVVIGGIFAGGALSPGGMPGVAELGLLAVAMALVAFNEEFTFRGAVMGVAMRRGAPVLAVAVSAVLFGLAHYVGLLGGGDLGLTTRQVMAATLFGVALGLVRLRMPSLWPLVAMHGLWNVAVLSAGDATSLAGAGPAGTLMRVLGVILILSAVVGVVVKALRRAGRTPASTAPWSRG
jgi:membrane protease YdiL (CAAX protease family)